MKLVLVGFGTIGAGLADLLTRRSSELRARGLEFRVVAVVDSRGAAIDTKGLDLRKLKARKRIKGSVGAVNKGATDVIEGVEADAVVEVTPGTMSGEPGLSHMMSAFKSGKSVVTANKMPLALHFGDLIAESTKRRVKMLYGACVGAGLPVLDFGNACASAEPIDGIRGVLNATTNFILTAMEEGKPFSEALKDAKRLGYAEPDPSFDIDGTDTACKVVILANHFFGRRFKFKDVKPLGGIRDMKSSKVVGARRRGHAIRLVAEAGKSLRVGASEVEESSPLAVRGPRHAVEFRCRYSGDRAIVGKGAGSVTTSLAVLRDLITLARNMGA